MANPHTPSDSVDESPQLTAEEDRGLRLALESIERGRGRSRAQVQQALNDAIDCTADLDDDERAALDRELEQSFIDEEAGRYIDADVLLAELRALR